MGAEKIENVASSCFSAPIFLPAYLTNDRNSSNRELLDSFHLRFHDFPPGDFGGVGWGFLPGGLRGEKRRAMPDFPQPGDRLFILA